MHVPPTHVWSLPHASPEFCQAPAPSQVCGCCIVAPCPPSVPETPAHWPAPGEHATHAPFKQTGVAVMPVQLPPTFCHAVPAVLHCCGCAPSQPNLSGMHKHGDSLPSARQETCPVEEDASPGPMLQVSGCPG
jgi:hypothetical protein